MTHPGHKKYEEWKSDEKQNQCVRTPCFAVLRFSPALQFLEARDATT
jgi:hypothetical protein